MQADGGTVADAFGEVLREIRKRGGLTQEGLAHEAGLERTYISFMERGLRQPSLRVLFSICRALDVAPSDVVRMLEERLNGKSIS